MKRFKRSDFGDLSALEKKLLDEEHTGQQIWVGSMDRPDPDKEGVTDRTLRGSLLRAVILKQIEAVGPLDPQGVQIFGAYITETLNLDFVDTQINLRLKNSHFTTAPSMFEARLLRLDL